MRCFQRRAYAIECNHATEAGSRKTDRDAGTANVNRQWVRNVKKTLQIKISISGETFEGNGRFLADRAEHERAMAAIRRKYWMFRPIIALGRVLTAIGVMRDKTGSFEVTLAD